MRFLLTAVAFLPASCSPAGSLEAPHWEVRRDLAIGSYNRPDYDLVAVHDLTVDDGGRIYVLQRQLGTVRVFDPDGRFVRAIGRPGSGPGELGLAGKIGLRRDTLWISDRTNNRVTLYDSEGNHITDVFGARSGPGAYFGWRGPSALLADGTLMNVPTVSSEALAEGWVTGLPYVRSSVDGEWLDTILVQSMAGHHMRVMDPLRGPGHSHYVHQPFSDHDLTDVSGQGDEFVLVQRRAELSPSVTVLKLRAQGDTVFTNEIEVPPIPLKEDVVDEWVQEKLDLAEEIGTLTRTLEDAIREVLHVPEFLPAVTEVVLGRDGTVWLRRAAPEEAQEMTWSVVDEEGAWVADVALPADFRLLEVDFPHLYGVRTDEMDVPFVERYEVSR